jgi:hypothetical protein
MILVDQLELLLDRTVHLLEWRWRMQLGRIWMTRRGHNLEEDIEIQLFSLH